MAIRSAVQRKSQATAYGVSAPYGCLFTADPGTSGSATGEVTGGSPAYARVALAWNTATDNGTTGSIVSNAVAFNVPSGSTVTFAGCAVSGTAATADVRDSASVTSQPFASQGTYTLTATYSQT